MNAAALVPPARVLGAKGTWVTFMRTGSSRLRTRAFPFLAVPPGHQLRALLGQVSPCTLVGPGPSRLRSSTRPGGPECGTQCSCRRSRGALALTAPGGVRVCVSPEPENPAPSTRPNTRPRVPDACCAAAPCRLLIPSYDERVGAPGLPPAQASRRAGAASLGETSTWTCLQLWGWISLW